MKKHIIKITLLGALTLMTGITIAISTDDPNTHSIVSQLKTETFKVYGNCGMCKSRIERSLKDVEGVEKAEWNRETKMISVTFDEEQVTLDKIKKTIADAGHDTDDFKASDQVYDGLPGCCHYSRPE